MYATEFKTVVNEPYIHIPNYEVFKGHKVRVTLIDIEDKINSTIKNSNNGDDDEDFIKYLINNPAKVSKDFKFLTREEANER
jgi:hypothetical protein